MSLHHTSSRWAAIGLACVLSGWACSAQDGTKFTTRAPGAGGAGNGTGGTTTGTGGTGAGIGTGGTVGGIGTNDASTSADAALPCTNLQCFQNSCRTGACKVGACANGGTTSLSGVIYDPSGTLPLYNVIVYVPNAPLTPLPEGAGCKCEVNGDPIAAALTDTNGKFVMNDVPAGTNIPIVVQVGKWRRQFTIPSVGACVDTPVPDGTLRLPGRKADGDMPKIALTTGAADALECLIRKIGIDPAEITNPDGPGRVNFFSGHDGATRYDPAVNGGAAFPPASALWNSVSTLQPYDVVLLSCEGAEYLEEKAQGLKAMADYANLGGRVFASHWHQVWLKQNSNFPYQVAQYTSQTDIGDISASVVTTFPKGQALSEWLVNVQATPTAGQIPITNAQHTIVRENPLYAQRWITAATPPSVQYLSANTPLGAPPAMQCGRIVLSDLHVAGGTSTMAGTDSSMPSVPFPAGCVTTGLSPQEKVLAFMLFDITSCLIPDTERPVPPPVR
jgi:hypothetical protein